MEKTLRVKSARGGHRELLGEGKKREEGEKQSKKDGKGRETRAEVAVAYQGSAFLTQHDKVLNK